jgi:predicted MPP superfamily phosphohydrolase
MQLAWASDIHLDFVEQEVEEAFLDRLSNCGASALLLGGDIATAGRLESDLVGILEFVRMPIFFVLGNHDYYGGSIARVRKNMGGFDSPILGWLPKSGPVELEPGVSLVGHGGWGDATLGDFAASQVVLNDYLQIKELAKVFEPRSQVGAFGPGTGLEKELRKLGRNAARVLAPQLEMAAMDSRQIIVLTHVPPFREACWHEGAISSDDYLPAFSCGAVGEVIRSAAEAYPDRQFTVLCGHTHSGGKCQVLPNLVVHTQPAAYGLPDFDMLEVSSRSVRLVKAETN